MRFTFRLVQFLPVLLLVLALAKSPPTALAQEPETVNVPSFTDAPPFLENAVFWLGKVDNTQNYADVRLNYINDGLMVYVHMMDRYLWYDTTPTAPTLTEWDAVTLYLDRANSTANAPAATSYRFDVQFGPYHWDNDRAAAYQTAYRGNGSTWQTYSAATVTRSEWQGKGYNGPEARGWFAQIFVPYADIGLNGKPTAGTVWKLGVAVHDRDDAAGADIAAQTWPAGMNALSPATWGKLVFGRAAFTPPTGVTTEGTVTIRHGVNGAVVPDAHVGGHSVCGDPFAPNYFSRWGSANYAGYTQINIQNQWNIEDWPCFSKYYITFPLNTLPANRSIISATLTMYHFGNAGGGQYDPAQASYLQVFEVAQNWAEATITWNNAPPAGQNIGGTWVQPLTQTAPWPGVPVTWDVSLAAARAYQNGLPLRLALYSADTAMHSGKYFYSSNADEAARPKLTVTWGPTRGDDNALLLSVLPENRTIRPGNATTYTIHLEANQTFTGTVALTASAGSAWVKATVSPASLKPPGNAILTATDSRSAPLPAGQWQTIVITATAPGIVQTGTVNLLVGGSDVYLPVVMKSQK